jgi:hypothetical protein
MTIYKPAGPFTSASQRCFAPTIASTPVEVYERQVALEGINGYRLAFSTPVDER